MARARTTSPSFDRTLVDGPVSAAVWKITWPTLLQNVFAGLQGIIDHAMVGHYVGYTGNAAIGVSWQIFIVVVVFISSIYSGMGVMVARFAGAGQPEKVNRIVYQAFLVSTFLGIAIFAPVGYLAAPKLLELVHAAPAVRTEALPYLRVTFVCSFTLLHFFMLAGALRAAGDAKTPLRLGVIVTILNVVLNVVLIRGLGPIPSLGTLGAAIGSVIASGVGTLIGFYLLFSNRLVIQFSGKLGLKLDWKIVMSLFRFGLPTGFQGVAMNLAGVMLIRFVGSLPRSAEAQAVYAVGYTQLFAIMTWTSLALMASSSAVTGQNLGAGKPERAALAPRSAALIGLAMALPVATLFVATPRTLLAIFGMQGEGLIDIGSQLLSYLAVSSFLITIALSYTGALQGTGDTRSPLYITLISQLVLPIGWCAYLDATRGLTPADIWLAIVAGHLIRATLSFLRFQQGKWRDIRVEISDA